MATLAAMTLAAVIIQPLAAATRPPAQPRVTRAQHSPILTAAQLPPGQGDNLNGPALIRVPDWVEDPLGRYYLYFAHHVGRHIRLAYADDLEGPWTVFEPGVLPLERTPCARVDRRSGHVPHIASPDVHVDSEHRYLRMYVHCPVHVGGAMAERHSYRQRTLVATSSDGLVFETIDRVLGPAYLRVFEHDGGTFAVSSGGVLLRASGPFSVFEEIGRPLPATLRHAAVERRGERLTVVFSRVGDRPERLLLSWIELAGDPRDWSATEPLELLRPERSWEGAELPLVPSRGGRASGPVRQLRDPALFSEGETTWLVYAVAGESGLALARIDW